MAVYLDSPSGDMAVDGLAPQDAAFDALPKPDTTGADAPTKPDAKAGTPCLAGSSTCPNKSYTMLAYGSIMTLGNTLGSGNAFQGTCGGANAEEYTVYVKAYDPLSYMFTVTAASFDAVLYVLDGKCTGKVLGCSATSPPIVAITMKTGQEATVVVDGASKMCGDFELMIVGQ